MPGHRAILSLEMPALPPEKPVKRYAAVLSDIRRVPHILFFMAGFADLLPCENGTAKPFCHRSALSLSPAQGGNRPRSALTKPVRHPGTAAVCASSSLPPARYPRSRAAASARRRRIPSRRICAGRNCRRSGSSKRRSPHTSRRMMTARSSFRRSRQPDSVSASIPSIWTQSVMKRP